MILVAGGTGRLGTLLVRRLAGRGLEVCVLTRDAPRAAHLLDQARVVTGDVRDPAAVAKAVAGAAVVVSAIHGFVGPGGVSPATVDRDGNANLTDAAKAAGALVDHVVTEPGSRGQTLGIGGPDNLSFNQLAAAVQAADGHTGSPRHVPPAMLWLTANSIGRFKPELARQTRAALAMDRVDLTFDPALLRPSCASLPNTSLTDVLARRDVGESLKD